MSPYRITEKMHRKSIDCSNGEHALLNNKKIKKYSQTFKISKKFRTQIMPGTLKKSCYTQCAGLQAALFTILKMIETRSSFTDKATVKATITLIDCQFWQLTRFRNANTVVPR
jgi:hypothetical protein